MHFRDLVRLFAHLQLAPVLESGEEVLVGGQAVIEGVMMRAPHSYCVAVRRPDGQIVTEERPLAKVSEKYPIFKYPVLRGLGTLGQAMSLGIKALKFSANAAIEHAQAPASSANVEPIQLAATAAGGEGQTDTVTVPAVAPVATPKPKTEIPAWALTLNLVLSLAFFIFLYKFVPLLLATEIGKAVPVLSSGVLLSIVDGIIRMAIFVGFLFLISRWKDIHRVFEYHGAEHRVVFNFESGKPVTVENAQSFSTFHPRCGTSFLLVVMLVSIIIYALLPFDSFLMRFVGRIAFLPLIAGLSYEAIRYAAKHPGGVLSVLTAPGLWLQRITTQPPADDQTAVAIRALNGAMELEQSQNGQLVVA